MNQKDAAAYAVGALIGVAVGGAIGFMVGKPAAGPAGPGAGGGGTTGAGGGTTGATGPSSSGAWKKTTTMKGGDRIRASVTVAAFKAAVDQLHPPLPADLSGLNQLLQLPVVGQLLQTQHVYTYGPSDTLPADWPQDDPTGPGGFGDGLHIDFIYGGALTKAQQAALPQEALALIPINGLDAWVLTGASFNPGGSPQFGG